ncbi:DUF4189 domain-containing protein [Nocardia harenae]|uniref:DUF4189 domain-containing protein n=1 Tax=Nocardia harenae TaxID=358707 RepID=UPI0008296248|nr:DUF4189 domain-containing protein [Nocardia harenae]
MKKFVSGVAVAAAVGSALTLGAPSAQAARSYYGAIALSPATGLIGYSYDYADVDQATARALSSCGAADCQSLVWFANGCGAVAYSERTSTWSWAYGASRRSAQSLALNENYSDATIVHWNCTSNHSN